VLSTIHQFRDEYERYIKQPAPAKPKAAVVAEPA
jgi:hypothetical protein